jgi:hypothetical protein
MWFDVLINSIVSVGLYAKCGSCKCYKVSEKISQKFPGYTIPSTTGIYGLIKKVRSTGPLLDKKPAIKLPVLTEEKLDEMGIG